MMTTTSPAELITQFQTKYSKKLLPRTEELIVLDQFATKSAFPQNQGAKTMRMFRQTAVTDATGVVEATEGVPPTDYQEITYEFIEATLKQYVIPYKFSDVLGLTEMFSTLIAIRENIAQKMALHADGIVRNLIAQPTTGVTTNKFYAGGITSFNGLVAADPATGALTIQDLLRAMTKLDLARAPKKNGEYFAVVSPQVAYDLMLDTKFFIPVNTYQDKTNVVKGEVGKWFNVRVVKTTAPFREAATNGTEGNYAGSGPIFTTIVLGDAAFGTPVMDGQSPYSPRIYINDKPDKTDPANQFTIVAAKSHWASAMLQEKWAATIRSKSTYQ